MKIQVPMKLDGRRAQGNKRLWQEVENTCTLQIRRGRECKIKLPFPPAAIAFCHYFRRGAFYRLTYTQWRWGKKSTRMFLLSSKPAEQGNTSAHHKELCAAAQKHLLAGSHLRSLGSKFQSSPPNTHLAAPNTSAGSSLWRVTIGPFSFLSFIGQKLKLEEDCDLSCLASKLEFNALFSSTLPWRSSQWSRHDYSMLASQPLWWNGLGQERGTCRGRHQPSHGGGGSGSESQMLQQLREPLTPGSILELYLTNLAFHLLAGLISDFKL